MKIGIVGTRRRNTSEDLSVIFDKFKEIYKKGDIIVSGGCPKGGDKFAEEISERLNIPIVIHYPQWEKYGKGAGFVRNTLIAKDCDVVIACVAEDRKGGTEDTIKKVEKLRKRVYIV